MGVNMKNICKLIKLYFKLMAQQLKCMLEYKLDFILMMVFTAFTQISGLFFIYLIFSKVPAIAGWTMWEVVFMYSMIYFTEGVLTFLFEGTWILGQLINSGQLDRCLLRPLPIGMQILTMKINPDGLGKIVISLYLMIQSLSMLDITWGISKVIWFVIFILSASTLRVCLNFSANCICFWLKSSKTSLSHLIHTFSEFGKYPLTLFQSGIQFVLIFIIPYAFISYFPTVYLLEKGRGSAVGLLTPLVALIGVALTKIILTLGLRLYDSPGN